MSITFRIGIKIISVSLLSLAFFSCAPRPFQVPQDSGVRILDYEELLKEATQHCQRVKSLELLLAIKGKSGDSSIGGRVRAAIMKPSLLRLEGLAPYGSPSFVLISNRELAVLLLPRDRRAIVEATTADLLKSLTGLYLDQEDFLGLLTGCLVSEPKPKEARRYRGEMIGIELYDEARLYIQPSGEYPLIVAGILRDLSVQYTDYKRGLPRALRVQTASAELIQTDFRATLSQLNVNVDIRKEAFSTVVPDSFSLMTLDEFHKLNGPLK